MKEKGHPIEHAFTRAIPTAQCMNCHMHQPNIFLNSYLGYTMWDYESDAPRMWPGPDNQTPRPEGMSDAELAVGLAEGSLCSVRPNSLTLGIQPNARIALSFGVKEPGTAMRMAPAALTFDYAQHFGAAPPDAYERLLLDALQGDQTLFLRADEVEAAWEWTDTLRASWDHPEAAPLLEYPAGSWGPAEVDQLFPNTCEARWSRG